nr:SusF/SusE family outer membrane protein [uncultured Carboxylicivirga sp.]
MKTFYIKRALLTLVATIFLSSLIAQPDHVYLIGGPLNKNNPNWLLEHKIELTKDESNPSIFYFKGYLAYNWRGDERGNIKFLISDSWSDAFHPNSDVNIPLSGTTSMSQDSRDVKWFIPEDRSGDGYYELTLDTDLMTLTVDLFRPDLNPEKIFIVGESMPCGWDNTNPEVMERTNPEEAIYTWTGVMGVGNFKFLHPLSIGNWDFSYAATTANEPVNLGTPHDLVFEVRDSENTPFDDFKFIMNETAECTITVDLVNKTMTVIKNSEVNAQELWITGSAIPGGIAKLSSDNIDPVNNYHYNGELLLGEFKFRTTENIDATTQYYVPTSSSDAISEDISISLTSDETAQGWSVTQADNMYKVKLNILSEKYKGSILMVDQVYIVGGVTAVGWDAGRSIELTRGTGSESNIFTFDGDLTINTEISEGNSFKFLLQKDWNPKSFHPQFAYESITDAKFYTENHSSDFKWIVEENKQGHYIIKLDVLEETVQAIYNPDTPNSVTETELKTEILVIEGGIIVKSESGSKKSIEIINLIGNRIANKLFNYNTEVKLKRGIYIVKIIDENSDSLVKKVSIN